MIGSLFFEVEGVLASTAPLRRAALLRALADEGIEPTNAAVATPQVLHDAPAGARVDVDEALDRADETREVVRQALREHSIANDETAITLIALRADRNFASLVQAGVSLAPGARELLHHAAARCRLAIVTGLPRAVADALLSLAELDGAFEVIVAAEDVASVKPAPDGYRKALERMHRRRPVDVSGALALESGATGARAARAAGLRCIVVAPFRVESIVDADAMLTSLVGETPASLDAMLSLKAAG
jgi:beta-phosphoglucomutase-like phosphatase (HAD superfamily)